MVFALQTLSDKPYMGSVTSGPNAADTIRMGEILFGGREAIERAPASISLINVNSPLRYDDRMLGAMFEYVKAAQAVVITPFLLMGAMSPVSLPATLVQQIAEALAGIALAQLIRPGAPVVFGSFLSNTDMQSGSPSFGTPESGIGVLCTGQIARHFGLPWRGGGALNASQTVDAQAAYESLMTLLPTFLAGANFVMHSAGWLEGGLVSCYEKFIVDIELLRELKHEFTPLEIDEATLAFDAHLEVGAGGHFLGAVHTLERFRECFYRPLLSSTENFDRWTKKGAVTRRRAPARSGARRSRATSSRRSTTRSAPSSRSTWSAAAPSSATDWPRRLSPRARSGVQATDGVAGCLQRADDLGTVIGAPGLECDLDPGLTHMQRNGFADVVGVHDVAARLGDRRQQRGQAAGAVRDAREQPQPAPGGGLVALGDRGQQTGVDVAAREDDHGRALRRRG